MVNGKKDGINLEATRNLHKFATEKDTNMEAFL